MDTRTRCRWGKSEKAENSMRRGYEEGWIELCVYDNSYSSQFIFILNYLLGVVVPK